MKERYIYAEWHAEGVRRFGPDYSDWKFVCPVCKNVARVNDYRPHVDKGADANSATCECIGRYTGAKDTNSRPCIYAGYGLFRLSPVVVIHTDGKELHGFAFAKA